MDEDDCSLGLVSMLAAGAGSARMQFPDVSEEFVSGQGCGMHAEAVGAANLSGGEKPLPAP
ncbi:MAG: hypothetical protein ACK6CT_11565 [Planctomycetia bacterium]|jgi:hypothetical protein